MKFRMVANYVVITICCGLLIVATLFLVLQWGNTANISVFGRNTQANTALLVFFSGLGGCVLAGTIYWLVRNLLTLRGRKRALQSKESRQQTARRLEELEKKASQSADQSKET